MVFSHQDFVNYKCQINFQYSATYQKKEDQNFKESGKSYKLLRNNS